MSDGTTVGALLVRIRRYWLFVLAVTVVAVLGGLAATVMTPTTYVGRTSLIVSSNNRSPDQDAVLVQGYVDYFDDSAYQEQLLASVGVHDDVQLSAAPAASSPILVISATTLDRAVAQSYAVEVAGAFMNDINRSSASNKAKALAALQAQLNTALASNSPNADSVVRDLQDQIDQIRSDTVNVLQQLQAEGGVSVQRPSLLNNLVLAVAGGLFVGLLAALVLARTSRRLRSGLDVADKVGLPTLVELPRPRGKAGRARLEQRLGQLASILRARLAGPGVVVVAQPEGGSASSVVARKLADEWVAQGHPTVVMSTEDGASASKAGERFEQEVLAGRYVVVDAPSVVRSSAAQAVCHAADQVVLIVDTRTSRVAATREAVAVLRKMGASMMGAVVATVRNGRGQDQDQLESAARLSAAPSVDDARGVEPMSSPPAPASSR